MSIPRVVYSLDLLDRFHLVVTDVATPEVVVGAVEAALERVPEAHGADLFFVVACSVKKYTVPVQYVHEAKLVKIYRMKGTCGVQIECVALSATQKSTE